MYVYKQTHTWIKIASYDKNILNVVLHKLKIYGSMYYIVKSNVSIDLNSSNHDTPAVYTHVHSLGLKVKYDYFFFN